MDKQLSTIVEQLGVTLKNDEDADKLISILNNKLKYYEEKNSQNEEWISKLKINPSNLNSESQTIINKFMDIIETANVDSLDINDIGLSLLETTENKYFYNKKLETLRESQNEYLKQTNKIKEECNNVQEEIKIAEKQINKINSVSVVDINSLKALVKKYQETFLELTEKNLWTRNEEYNAISIQEELKKLHKLRNEADKLIGQVSEYNGLKPDLESARIQLIDIKKEYETMHNNYKKFSK